MTRLGAFSLKGLVLAGLAALVILALNSVSFASAELATDAQETEFTRRLQEVNVEEATAKYQNLMRLRASAGRKLGAPLKQAMMFKNLPRANICPLAGKQSLTPDDVCMMPTGAATSFTPAAPTIVSYAPLCSTLGKIKVYFTSNDCNGDFTTNTALLAQEMPEATPFLAVSETAPGQDEDNNGRRLETQDYVLVDSLCFTDSMVDMLVTCTTVK